MNQTYTRYPSAVEFLQLENGGMEIIWAAMGPRMGAFIKEHKILSWSERTGMVGRKAATAEMVVPTDDLPFPIPNIPFPGIPVPHLHYGGEIYLLTKAQFQDFSQPLIKDFQKRFRGASEVSFGAFKAMGKAAELL